MSQGKEKNREHEGEESGAMTPFCYAAAVLLLALGYYEWTIRKELLFSFWDYLVRNNFSPVKDYLLYALPSPRQWLEFPLYVAFLWICSIIVPGYYHKGTPLRDSSVVTFKINGLRLFFVLLATLFALVHFGIIKATHLYDNFVQTFITVNTYAIAVSTFLFIKGTLKENKVEGEGIGGLKGFWLGEELMPFVFGMPLKFFWLRPSMMLWILINMSLLAKHYELYGQISIGMALYQVFSLSYVVDYFYHEEKMTSTWDIIAENFGFMLVWGDVVFIPFVFSIQSWYLLTDQRVLSIWQTLCIVAVFVVGYSIFRGSNSQKHQFKLHPNEDIWGKPPRVFGGRLLASGFWGLARHINYFGDILLGLSFSLPCLFSSVVPWVYPIYLTLLLVHREVRDNRRCRRKYGKVWEEYERAVPSRIIPFVY